MMIQRLRNGLCLFGLLLLSMTAGAQDASREIRQCLQQQQDDWNRGDVRAYMQGYWQSDSLAFISAQGTTYGWQPVRDHYLQSYPDQATMGQLSFSELHIHALSGNEYFVIGRWQLKRVKGDVGGTFQLLYRYIDNRWLIVMDYTL